MALSGRGDSFLLPSFVSRIRVLIFELQRWSHTSARGFDSTTVEDSDPRSLVRKGPFDPSCWKTVDSRTVGISRSAISSPTWTVLKVLKRKGFEAYLVGGCVRDLLLKRIPKDFDVVTTASLRQIKKQFHRCIIVGRRFPICQVQVLGSIVEVSSFSTKNEYTEERQQLVCPEVSHSCEKKDILRWKNCMGRDFTINGLFFDPFDCTIYDYVNGISDIRTSKVSTVIPAHLSFKEDCARILRGLRIVARLGFRFSKETATAIQDLSSSIIYLDKSRLLMELNFMLAYGAAVSSIYLLQKYRLLPIFLPFHAAYLADQTKDESNGRSNMLMRLFSSVDKLLAADRPCDCALWLGLLAFHLALVDHPQDSLVVWAFSSILYYGTWTTAIQFIRENAKNSVQFVPETIVPSGTKSDELLMEEVSHLASLVKSSVYALTSLDALHRFLARYQEPSSCLGLVFVSEKMGKNVSKLFDVLDTDIASYQKKRERYDINYNLLKKGDPDETRFAIGKIIMDAMNDELSYRQTQSVTLKQTSHPPLSSLFK
ncbi:uncharacterized protein [Typha latifolia]|uniref:uncharacterized protein n=1 Tax=Typha latifolia TaxID=4733 RepID=UPI003C2BB2BA